MQCYQCAWCGLKYAMLSVYLVQVKVYNAISVAGAGLDYAMLSEYLVMVRVYNAICVAGEG